VDLDIKQYLISWTEQYLFFPNVFQRLLSVAMFPFTIIYCIIIAYRRSSAKEIDFGINIVSIGNLVIGGSGKTPITIALAKNEDNAAIILRGYGRKSKGLFVVSTKNGLLEDVSISGDEAQLLARKLPNAIVIVSENKEIAVLKAKELGANIVFLDDGYSSYTIKKYNILIRPKEEPTNFFCLPSGGYREARMMYSFVPLVLKDGVDFNRIVSFKQNGHLLKDLPKNILLVSAISKANRLYEYLPKGIKKEIFLDHYNFSKQDILNIQKKYKDYFIVTTEKDLVKLEQFDIHDDIIIMELDIHINKEVNYNFN
jgi:tetraacyldisaccharide 4'-kinase